jgi:hypothetical protein
MTSLPLPDAGNAATYPSPRQAIIAGWAGRNADAIRHHIDELGALGVPAPSAVPLYYRVSANLFTTASAIEAVGTDSSGEVEPVLFQDGRNLRLGLGSDHTDRALEAHSVALSKQVCAKPIAPQFWNFEDVEPHADLIEFSSWIRDSTDREWTLYQRGRLADLRPLRELVSGACATHGDHVFADGTIMMCGTFGVVSGNIRPARYFRMSMHDPVLGRTIEPDYETLSLPNIA